MVPARRNATGGSWFPATNAWARPTDADSQWHRRVLSIKLLHSNRLIPNVTLTAMFSLKQKEKGRDGKSENNQE